MKVGDCFYARTHAEFLNRTFGTNYKAWMKSVWTYDADTIVWIVRFDGKIRDGWKNYFVSGNRIYEENLYRREIFYGKSMRFFLTQDRIVIEIDDSSSDRKYVFRGVFRYDKNNSDPYMVRYYDKISDEFIIKHR